MQGREEGIMAIIYRKFEPTEYVMKVRKGVTVAKGKGLAFFCNTLTTSIVVIPTTAMEASFAFDDIMTSDYQKISVQGDVSYVIKNYEIAAKMLDFSYRDKAAENAAALAEAKNRMNRRILNLTRVYIARCVNEWDVRNAIKNQNVLAGQLLEALKGDQTLAEFGLEVMAVSVLGVLPQPDTRKALEAATREEILKQQDDAIYKRRNAAIEQERAIKENELNTEIRVAEKEKEKREREMETRKMLAEREAQLKEAKIAADIALEQENRKLVDLQTENERKKSDAKAYDSEVLLRTFAGVNPDILKALAMSGMDSKALIAKAFVEIGDKADKIGTLNVSPDLLEALAGGN